MIKVFLDDVRPAPDGWVLVKSVHECVELLHKGGVTHLSLDNDLGPDAIDGWRVMAYLETRCAGDPDYRIPHVRFHTSNPVAKDLMARILQSIRRNFPDAVPRK